MGGARAFAFAVAALAVIAAIAACSGGPSPARARSGQHSQAVGTGYLAAESDSVAFIQWVDDHGMISGTAQVVGTQGSAPQMAVTSRAVRVTGTMQGSTLRVSFDGQPDTFGTVSGSHVTLNFPQSDGTLAATTFRKASTAAFDQAVSKLRTAIIRSNQQAEAAQARADAEKRLDSEAQDVATAVDQLSGERSALAADLEKLPATLQQQATDRTKTANDKQSVLNEATQFPNGNEGQVCYDASQVAYDASQVAYDASTISYNATSIESDISAIREEISVIGSNVEQYRAGIASTPQYVPANPPDETTIAHAITDGNAVVRDALSTANGDLDRANAAVGGAYQDASAAAQAGNCGAAPTAPTPQTHIN